MLLIFHLTKYTLRYGVYTAVGEAVFEQSIAVLPLATGSLLTAFRRDVLTRVQAHGKVFSKIGFVIPFAESVHDTPELAHVPYFRSIKEAIVADFLAPHAVLFELIARQWSHLPIFFLFDTCLSSRLPRELAAPAMGHDAVKQFGARARLLTSFGHKANARIMTLPKPTVSLVLDDVSSLALWRDGELLFGLPAYSPYPNLMGLGYGGLDDSGLTYAIGQQLKPGQFGRFNRESTGLFALTGLTDFDVILQLSGLARQPRTDLPDLAIETIESIELATRRFIWTTRVAITALITDHIEARTVIALSSAIDAQSPFWSRLTSGSLSHLKLIVNPASALSAAALDLAAV